MDELRTAVTELETWKSNKTSKITTEVDKGASLLLNYGRLAPSVKLKWLHDELEKRAHQYGIAFIGFHNTGGLLWLSLYTAGLARRRIVGICMFNGGPGAVIPYGGTDGFFGTNPMSYVIPTSDASILADMATSEVPFFEYNRAKMGHKKLSRIGRVTADGVPTDDPEHGTEEHEARLLPMGGNYKGYALNLLIEVLTGNLVRSLSGGSAKNTEYTPYEYGGVLMGIDVGSFTNPAAFTSSLSAMTGQIRTQKPAKNGGRIYVPGDQSAERLQVAKRRGTIDVEDDVIDKLKNLIDL
jgi:LDH2 family malate/lactate/ureidoglycolate dehydrogenase